MRKSTSCWVASMAVLAVLLAGTLTIADVADDLAEVKELQKKGSYREAIPLLEEVLVQCEKDLDPTNYDRAAVELVSCHLGLRDFENAENAARAAVGRLPHIQEMKVHVLKPLAAYAEAQMNFQKAAELFEEIARSHTGGRPGQDLAAFMRRRRLRGWQIENTEELLEESVMYSCMVPPDYDIQYMEHLRELGDLSLEKGKLDKAAWCAKLRFIIELGSSGSLALLHRVFAARDTEGGDMVTFCKFQTYGREGEDGKMETEDDLNNPLDDMHAPPSARRDAIIREVLSNRPKNDFRARGYMYLFSDEPEKALKEFYKHYLTCLMVPNRLARGYVDLTRAVTAVTGRLADIDQIEAWLTHGAEGKDGQPSTEDDLKNPFPEEVIASLLPAKAPAYAEAPAEGVAAPVRTGPTGVPWFTWLALGVGALAVVTIVLLLLRRSVGGERRSLK